MRELTSRRRIWRAISIAAAAVVAVTLVTALTLALWPAKGTSFQTVELQGISREDLARNGLTLGVPPPGATTAISRADAAAVMAKMEPAALVKEIVLAQVLDNTRVPPADRLLWVASMDVSGARMPLHGAAVWGVDSTPYIYRLVLIDPATGNVLGEVSLGAPLATP